jgi:hypothetical protein
MKKQTQSQCRVCKHPERARIELLRISGVGLATVAAQFGVSTDSVWRHMARHVSERAKAQYLADVPVSEMVARAADEGVSLLDFFKIIRGTLMKQFQLAAAVNDRHATASLAGRLNETLGLIGKLTGELLRLAPGTITNNTAIFINSPAFADLQSMLIQRLATHPEALSAVIAGLRELEATAEPPPAIIDARNKEASDACVPA